MNKYINKMIQDGWDDGCISELVNLVDDYQIAGGLDRLANIYRRVITMNCRAGSSCYKQFDTKHYICDDVHVTIDRDNIKLVVDSDIKQSIYTLYNDEQGFTYWMHNDAVARINRIVESLLFDLELVG